MTSSPTPLESRPPRGPSTSWGPVPPPPGAPTWSWTRRGGRDTQRPGPAFHADNILKGKSLFKDLLGQTVGRPTVTLVDDGRLPGAMNLAPVDGEGTPTRRTALIDRGVLSGYLHSTRPRAG